MRASLTCICASLSRPLCSCCSFSCSCLVFSLSSPSFCAMMVLPTSYVRQSSRCLHTHVSSLTGSCIFRLSGRLQLRQLQAERFNEPLELRSLLRKLLG